ncbi:hypothetical protein SAMN05216525_1245 [Bradyrhizobium sp. Gha]|nr:hypothetical protein SAMN05216525_1245 [Bradyrhizobium sp. Gha]
MPTEPGLHLEPVLRQPAERQDVRGAWRQVPALPMAWGCQSEPEMMVPDELQAPERALPSGLALRWAAAGPRPAA